jgi:hypothetical protein
MSEIRIILETGAEANSIAKANEELKEMQRILGELAANKTALGGAESLANVQKLTAETKKLEAQVVSLQAKQQTASEKEKKAITEQSGLLWQLVTKKKQLQGSLVGAKTVDDVRRINSELARTNIEIVKLKNTGVSSFNTFEKAISSFQFKFNFLGNFVSGIAGGLFSGGIGLITTALTEAIESMDLFGESTEEAAERIGKLKNASQAIADALHDFRVGEIQNRIDIAKAREKLDGETIESAKNISQEEQNIIIENLKTNKKALDQKALDQRKAQKELDFLISEDQRIITGLGREGTEERKNELSKEQRLRKEALILQIREQKAANIILNTESEKLNAQLEANNIALNAHVKEIDDKESEESKKRIDKRTQEIKKSNKEIFDEAIKQFENLKKLGQAEESPIEKINREHEERLKATGLFGRDILTLTEFEHDQLLKEEQDYQDQLNKIVEKSLEDQQKLRDAAFDLEEKGAKEEHDAFLKNKKIADDEVEKARKNELEQREKITDQIFSEIEKRKQKEIAAIEEQLSAQDQAITRQQELADKGLANTLAFEEKRKAELEQKQRDEQKRLERLKKIEAYYNLFASYAKDDPKTAALKAFKDIAIAEAITAAFAQEGGIGEDIKDRVEIGSSGLSKTHGGGNDMMVVMSKKEGILTENEISALGGKDGFYNLKQILNNPSDDGEFVRAERSFAAINAPKMGRKSEESATVRAINKLNEKFDSIPKIQTSFDGVGNLITRQEVAGIITKTIRPKRQI